VGEKLKKKDKGVGGENTRFLDKLGQRKKPQWRRVWGRGGGGRTRTDEPGAKSGKGSAGKM